MILDSWVAMPAGWFRALWEPAGALSALQCGPACAQPASLERTAAYLLASLIFYIPANLLPVMGTSRFGSGSDSTILGGVVEFLHAGAWDIALIIFIASVAVPGTKFLVLGLLLSHVRRHSAWARRQRTHRIASSN